jgi:hypothetical protein
MILFTMRPWSLPRAFSLLSERDTNPGYTACILITLCNTILLVFRSGSAVGDSHAPEIIACKTRSILLN